MHIYLYLYIIYTCAHNHNFMKHVKFTLIVQLSETSNVSKDTLRLRLKQIEYFLINKLKTLALER